MSSYIYISLPTSPRNVTWNLCSICFSCRQGARPSDGGQRPEKNRTPHLLGKISYFTNQKRPFGHDSPNPNDDSVTVQFTLNKYIVFFPRDPIVR